jgi:hypothetical protein
MRETGIADRWRGWRQIQNLCGFSTPTAMGIKSDVKKYLIKHKQFFSDNFIFYFKVAIVGS